MRGCGSRGPARAGGGVALRCAPLPFYCCSRARSFDGVGCWYADHSRRQARRASLAGLSPRQPSRAARADACTASPSRRAAGSRCCSWSSCTTCTAPSPSRSCSCRTAQRSSRWAAAAARRGCQLSSAAPAQRSGGCTRHGVQGLRGAQRAESPPVILPACPAQAGGAADAAGLCSMPPCLCFCVHRSRKG